MVLQSIRRTRVGEVAFEGDQRTYRAVWPEFRLSMSADDAKGIAGRISVAIVDSGTPDSASSAGASARAMQSGSSGERRRDRDDEGHATLLAGRIAGRRGTRSADIELIFYKFCGAQGWPKADAGADQIRQAAARKKCVIVLAWDVAHATAALKDAVLAVQRDAIVVAAAGNWSLDNDLHPNWPANYGRQSYCGEPEMDHVITVMATDEHDERASYSSYGRTSVYIAAPGFARVAAASSSSALRRFGSMRDSELDFRGTSAATAYVARLAALVWAKNPNWTPQQVKAHIGKTARKVGSLTPRCYTGAIADFAAALK